MENKAGLSFAELEAIGEEYVKYCSHRGFSGKYPTSDRLQRVSKNQIRAGLLLSTFSDLVRGRDAGQEKKLEALSATYGIYNTIPIFNTNLFGGPKDHEAEATKQRAREIFIEFHELVCSGHNGLGFDNLNPEKDLKAFKDVFHCVSLLVIVLLKNDHS